MENTQRICANELTHKTYRYLNVNGRTMEIPTSFPAGEKVDCPHVFQNREYGISEEVLALHREATTSYRNLTEEDLGSLVTTGEGDVIETVDIHVEAGKSSQGYLEVAPKTGFHSSLYRIHLEAGAKGKFFILCDNPKETPSFLSFAIALEENAHLELYYYQLGEGDVISNMVEFLQGEGSSANVKAIYLAKENRELDFLYDIFHEGCESKSDLIVNGIMMDEARKIFKSRLDFAEGSSGSVGNEEEFVILLDETAKSLSVPALLSHEDDVEGNHAASAGKVDEDLIFYLMTRGFSESLAERMVIESRIGPVIEQIPYEEKREEIRQRIATFLEERYHV